MVKAKAIIDRLEQIADSAEKLGIELANLATVLRESDDKAIQDTEKSSVKPVFKPSWYLIAARMVGHVREVAGRASNKIISDMWQAIGWSPQPDSVAWCAVFINHCLDMAGYVGTNSPRARSFEDYGEHVMLDEVKIGDIVVLKRGTNPALGHVTLFEDFIDKFRFHGLGGNQRDSVCVSSYSIDDIVAIRRPTKGHGASEGDDNG